MTSVDAAPCLRALVVQSYSLLGEGIADLLRQRGISVVVADASNPAGVEEALGTSPCLVILDRADAEVTQLVVSRVPAAQVMDVSCVIGRGYPAAADLMRFEAILDALGVAAAGVEETQL